MLEQAQPDIEKLEQVLRQELLREWTAQGHNMSGKAIEEMDIVLKETAATIAMDFLIPMYAYYQETGVPASSIPFSGIGGGGRSLYIEGLRKYAQARMGLSSPEALSVAFAIAYTHKKDGMPSSGSYRFSQTGKRTEWFTEAMSKNESMIRDYISKMLSGIIQVKFINLVRVYQEKFKEMN